MLIISKISFVVVSWFLLIVPVLALAEEIPGPTLPNCSLPAITPTPEGIYDLTEGQAKQPSSYNVSCLAYWSGASPFLGKAKVVAITGEENVSEQIVGTVALSIAPPAQTITIPAETILSPGNYSFLIRLENESGATQGIPAELAVIIPGDWAHIEKVDADKPGYRQQETATITVKGYFSPTLVGPRTTVTLKSGDNVCNIHFVDGRGNEEGVIVLTFPVLRDCLQDARVQISLSGTKGQVFAYQEKALSDIATGSLDQIKTDTERSLLSLVVAGLGLLIILVGVGFWWYRQKHTVSLTPPSV